MQEAARKYADREVQKLFDGRKGHGGREGIVKRVLKPKELEDIIYGAFLAGAAKASR